MKKLPELLAVAALVAVGALAVVMLRPGAGTTADPADPASSNSFVVRGARVFDGERELGVATVVVRDGRIEAVAADIEVPAGLTVVDGRGKTLLPGLIDAHVHAWGEGQRDMARFGVTTGLDMHGPAQRLPQLRAQRQSLENRGQADLWAAGVAITAPGGHGTQYGFPVPTVDADTDVDAFIGERVEEGADYIKLIIEDLSVYGSMRLPTLSPAQVAATTAAAHARDRRAVVHVARQQDARQALEAGVDGLIHVFTDEVADEAFIASMRERGAFVVPTLAVAASMGGDGEGRALLQDARIGPLLSTEQEGTLAADFGAADPQRLQRALESVRRLHAAGVDVLAGSDAPNPGTAHGASLHHELELLVRAGLTPAQALAAATSVPARRFDLPERGRIAPGMRADLVLVDGDPLQDITTTRAIASVWKNGYRVRRDATAAAVVASEAVPADTLVSDFDDGAIAARFGSWQPTTDQMNGGASVVEPLLVAGGADGSSGALRVRGEIRPGFAFPWSGVIFFPASQPMQPADLSSRTELVLQVRGDGRSYNAMLFSGSGQGMPIMQSFVAGPEWTQVRLALADFRGADPAQLRGIAFTAGQPHGAFEFDIDQVELR